MTPERWMLVKRLLQEALERPAEDRPAFLAGASAGDDALREEVEALLAERDSQDPFLEAPPLAPAGPAAGLAATVPNGWPRVCGRCGARVAGGALACPRDGELLAEDPDWLVGQTLDGLYRVEAVAGRGGMGVVYRARHALLRDLVAVKVLPGAARRGREWLERFVREGRAARRFRHPNAVAVYDLRVSGETAYLVLEYVEGRTLRAELRARGPLAPAEAVELLAQVASALDAAHAAGVVHRDVKPENVMLTREAAGADGPPLVKVLDFGVARLFEPGEASGEADLTAPGAVLGTVVYMSPEQWGLTARDGVAGVDGRADVYSLGVMAFEMVTGSLPFTGDSAEELRRKHVGAEPPSVTERAAGLPEGLARAIARAIAKDRGDRPATAGALVAELRAALGGAAPLATGESRATTGGGAPGGADTAAPGRGGPAGPAPAAEGAAAPGALPRRATRFVGRDGDLAAVGALLAAERLVTVTGPGGVGKTRLALEVASRGPGAPGRAWLVELAAVADAALVGHAIARSVGAREEAGRPVLDSAAARIAGGPALLVLDNCEHLVDACAGAADALLRACPALRILATSREALGVEGESLHRLGPLATPAPGSPETPERVMESEAVRLFVDRVRLGAGGFELGGRDAPAVARICRRLEGLPLALELAASRARALSLAEIERRLDDQFCLLAGGSRTAPARHQTLRATLDWGHALLTAEERALLGRLSVFSGGFTLERAERAGAGDGVEAGEVLDLVTRLVDKSLVVFGGVAGGAPEARYGMLETVRQYALARLREAGGEDDARRRHAEAFVEFAEGAAPGLTGPDVAEWLERIEAEHDNLRAALRYLAGCDPDGCMRLAVSLRYFWSIRGYLTEGRFWLEAVLDRCRAAGPAVCVGALRGVGYLAGASGDVDAARAYFEEALAVARAADDLLNVTWSSQGLGQIAFVRGELAEARDFFREALACAVRLGKDLLIGEALNALGEIARAAGDLRAARSYYEESLGAFRRSDSHIGAGASLLNLGLVAFEEGDVAAAGPLCREALAIADGIGEKLHVSVAIDALGAVAARLGEPGRAARLAGAAEALRRANGYQLPPSERAFRERYVAAARGVLGDEAFDGAAAEGGAITPEEAVRSALDGAE